MLLQGVLFVIRLHDTFLRLPVDLKVVAVEVLWKHHFEQVLY